MTKALAAAYTRARSVSLHYKSGTSDKVYNLQMTPSLHLGIVGWDVRAQHGRSGSNLVNRSKIEGSSYYQASDEYDRVLAEKTSKGYKSVALTGKSVLTGPAFAFDFENWPGFEELLKETNTVLATLPNFRCTPLTSLALARLAYAEAEGVTDAFAALRGARGISEVKTLLGEAFAEQAGPETTDSAAQELMSASMLYAKTFA